MKTFSATKMTPFELLRARSTMWGQKQTAEYFGISPQYLCDILKKRREISASLADRMGYQRVVMFVKKDLKSGS